MPDTLAVMGRPKKVDAENARISREIMRKIRFIAGRRGITAPDYLNETLKPLVDSDHSKEFDKMAKELAAEQKRKRD